MRVRDHSAGPTAHHFRPSRLDLNPQPDLIALNPDHVQPGKPTRRPQRWQ